MDARKNRLGAVGAFLLEGREPLLVSLPFLQKPVERVQRDWLFISHRALSLCSFRRFSTRLPLTTAGGNPRSIDDRPGHNSTSCASNEGHSVVGTVPSFAGELRHVDGPTRLRIENRDVPNRAPLQ